MTEINNKNSKIEGDQSMLAGTLSSYTEETPESFLFRKDLRAQLEDSFGVLSDRQRQVIELRFLEEYTLEEIGLTLNFSATNARALEEKAIKKLQHYTITRKLASFLEDSLYERYIQSRI